jgi:chromate transporter
MNARRRAGVVEVFRAFLLLGLSAFGGPVAHLGYFHREFVLRRRWLSEQAFAQLLALTQLLPGPASSQLGFALGLLRAGWGGGVAAFLAFTLPSALLLVGFAMLLPALDGPLSQAALHGLKLTALAVVAHGVLGLARRLCADGPRALIAALAAGLIWIVPLAWMQLLVIGLGALSGLLLRGGKGAPEPVELTLPHGSRAGLVLLAAFILPLLLLPFLSGQGPGHPATAGSFYQAGALVFGGGHVVLPLLEESVVNSGWITQDEFLAGYGAAQAVPGPMFSLAAFLGARLPGAAGGLAGAALALGAIFLPGLLLVAAVLPWWQWLSARPAAARIAGGIGAAVVGLLGAALYDPVFTSAVRGPADLAIATVGFALLAGARIPALWTVGWCVAASIALHRLI